MTRSTSFGMRCLCLVLMVAVTSVIAEPPNAFAAPILTLTKQVCNAAGTSCGTSLTVPTGSTVTYVLTYGNAAGGTPGPITITDTVQPGQHYAGTCGATPPTGITCPPAGSTTLTFTTPPVAAGSSGSITFPAVIDASSGTIPDYATATSPVAGTTPTTSNYTFVTVSSAPPPTSGLSLTKTVSNASRGSAFSTSTTANSGDTLTYRVVVANTGTAPLTSVNITDPLSPGQVFDPGACTGCSYSGGTVSFNVGTLTPGASVTLSFNARVSGAASGQIITNTASGTASGMGAVSSGTTSVTVGYGTGCTSYCTPCQPSYYGCGQYPCTPTSYTCYSYPCSSYACYPPNYYPPGYYPPTYFQSSYLSTEVLCGVISGYRPPAGGAGYITVNGETIILQPTLVPGGIPFNIGSAYCVTFTLAANGQVASLTVTVNLPSSNYVCGTVTPFNPGYWPYPVPYGGYYSPYAGYNPNASYTPAPNYGPYPYPMANGYYGWGGPMVIGGYPYQVSPNIYFPYSPQYNNPYCFLMNPQGVITGSLSVVPTAARQVEQPSGYRKGHGINF